MGKAGRMHDGVDAFERPAPILTTLKIANFDRFNVGSRRRGAGPHPSAHPHSIVCEASCKGGADETACARDEDAFDKDLWSGVASAVHGPNPMTYSPASLGAAASVPELK